MRRLRLTLVSLVFCAVTLALLVWLAAPKQVSTGAEDVSASAPQHKLPTVQAANTATPISAAPTARPQATGPAFSLTERVRSLAKSPDPIDAYRAYVILSECKSARDEEHVLLETKQADRDPNQVKLIEAEFFKQRIMQACGDLTAGEIAGRLALIERAAEAGVPVAALQMSNEGPWGDPHALYTRWSDPLVQDWRAKVVSLITRSAEKGDIAALTSLAAQYESGSGLVAERDLEVALKYVVAQNVLHEAKLGRPVLGGEKQARELSARLSTEAAERARDAGIKLAKAALGGN